MQVCDNVFNLTTDWQVKEAENMYVLNPSTGEVLSNSKRRSLLASSFLSPSSRSLLGGGGNAAAEAASAPVCHNLSLELKRLKSVMLPWLNQLTPIAFGALLSSIRPESLVL